MACKINANLNGIDGKALRIVNFFVGKGLTPIQGCAICGNVSQESGYDEKNINSRSGAFGLFQYLPIYFKDLINSPNRNDFDYQLEYTWKQYSTQKHYGDSNKGSAMYKKWHTTELREYFSQNKGTLYDYVELWMCAFERCGVAEANLNNRKAEAKRVAELYNQYASGECGPIDLNGIGSGDGNTDSNNGAVLDTPTVSLDCPSPNINTASNDGGGGTGTSSMTGFSGEVTNPKMKKVLEDVSYYRLPSHSGNGAKKKMLPHNYTGQCTAGPSTWYKNAGIDLYWWCGQKTTCVKRGKKTNGYPYIPNFDCIKNTMHQYGFYCAGHWDFDEARNLPTSVFRPGDCAALSGGNCATHGLMWTGHDWRSDCIEENICSAYKSISHGKFGNYSVSIWRRRDCQEPGLENDPEVL